MNPLGNLFDLVPGFIPVDTQTAANTGDYISLKNAEGVLVVFFKAVGVHPDDPVLELLQATTVAGGGAKDCNGFTGYWHKQGADLTAVGSWTHVTQTADEHITLNGTSAESAGLYAIWVPATVLDRDNGFDCLCVNVADTGAAGAQLGCLLYIVVGLRYQTDPENLPSLITN